VGQHMDVGQFSHHGDLDWIAALITENSCAAVTDGLYTKELHPYLNLAAFVLECSKGRGRLIGSFLEKTSNAGSYRGELLSLMAIHLILRSLNEVFTDLRGSVHIYSDCLGALNKVKNLGPHIASPQNAATPTSPRTSR